MKPTATTIALAAILAGTSHAAISGKKPAFMNMQKLAEMRAEAASKSIKETEDPAFFTGKPYVASSGAYSFKYRSYSPGIARWTSVDPSGFPDGANANFYAPKPTTGYDSTGLSAADLALVQSVITLWDGLGFTFSSALANHSVDQGEDRNATSAEITALQNSSKFTSVFNKAYFTANYGSGGSGNGLVNYNSGTLPSDLGHSYGQVSFSFDVTKITGGYKVDYSFSDKYDFNPTDDNGAIRAFNRMQEAGILTIFDSSGEFTKYYE